MKDLLDMDREAMAAELGSSLGLAPFRSRQLINWIYRQRVTDFELMSNIAKSVREQLQERYRISRPELKTMQQSEDGTRKYLFAVSGGDLVETVLIKQPARYTLCVSSQVGCAMGCTFCRTGLMGLKRNLRTAEIVGQVIAVRDDLQKPAAGQAEEAGEQGKEPGEAIDFYNIVFMGMGEPFHNLKNVIAAVKLLNDPLGLNYSARKVTVSTSGIVPAIEKFGESHAGANLAVSLNATTDEVRSRIMPINRKWPLAALIGALRRYPLKKGRRITIEYVMLHGLNDNKGDLQRLPQLLDKIPLKINLIPYNASAGLGYEPPPRDLVFFWQERLLAAGLNATIRWSKGNDIDAACGQLATASRK